MAELTVLLLALVVWPFVAMWRAYAIIVLWGWFVSPVTNIPAPSIYFTVGMMMVLALILPHRKHPKEEGDPIANYIGNVAAYGFILPALAIGFGWVWKWLQWGVA
jgi:uncharacterized membrane protein